MHCSPALFTICDSVVNKITLMANSKPTKKKSEEECAKITDTLTESVKWCIDMKWQIPVFLLFAVQVRVGQFVGTFYWGTKKISK